MAYLEFERPLVELEKSIADLRLASPHRELEGQVAKLEERVAKLTKEIFADLTPWQKVLLSRHPDRPHFVDLAGRLFTDFVELHGDRRYADDPAVITGFATFSGQSVCVIGQEKGRSTRDRVKRNFGMAHPEGYRKALRIVELAERYRRPVLTFIDTPGAYPGVGAEERGQSEAIGESILRFSQLKVPIIATVIGEGGSGGALALAVSDRTLMLEYSTLSVITPEGCASILWRDAAHAAEAAAQLKLLSRDAFGLGVVDEVVDEPRGGAHRDPAAAAELLARALRSALIGVQAIPAETLLERRYQRLRKLGSFTEDAPKATPQPASKRT